MRTDTGKDERTMSLRPAWYWKAIAVLVCIVCLWSVWKRGFGGDGSSGAVGVLMAVQASADGDGKSGSDWKDVRSRIEGDINDGRPLVVHLVAALCDNENQGIVPVAKSLGNGQDAGSNLYWGAMYGVRTFLSGKGGWKLAAEVSKRPKGVLDKIVLETTVVRSGRKVEVYLVAEAWDGREIESAIKRFLELTAGRSVEEIDVKTARGVEKLRAGGASHLMGYVGHNGLMDFSLDRLPRGLPGAKARSVIVLACKSKPYFQRHLKQTGAHVLLLTTGFMAPEAYTLDAALRSWAGGGEPEQVREGAARAYQKYQKCSLKAAENLFFCEVYPPKGE